MAGVLGKVLPLHPPKSPKKPRPKKWPKSAREGHRKGVAIPQLQRLPGGATMGQLGVVSGGGVGGNFAGCTPKLPGGGGVAEREKRETENPEILKKLAI